MNIKSWFSSFFPFGSQNRDGFERNHDNPLKHGRMTPEGILRLSAALACVRLTASTVSTLPFNVYEKQAGGGREVAEDYGLQELIHYEPNADMTAQSFWEAYVASIMLRGDGFARKHKKFTGNLPAAIDFLPRDRLSWTRNVAGGLTFNYINKKGDLIYLNEDEVFHTVGFSLDGCFGCSPIEYGCSVFGSALSADAAANSTFHRGLLPTVGFKMEQTLKKEQRKEFRDNFKSEMAGAMNAGKPFLLEGGMDAVNIGIKPSDAQLLESRAWSIEEVCRLFGTPPPLVGHSTKTTSWPTGNEAQMMMWLALGLRALLVKIEQSARRSLIPVADRKRYYVQHSLEGFLRADSAGRAAYLSTMTQNGLMTRDEARAYDDRSPHGGNAAQLTVQSNLVPIDKLGDNAAPGSQAAADVLKSWLGIEQHGQAANLDRVQSSH